MEIMAHLMLHNTASCGRCLRCWWLWLWLFCSGQYCDTWNAFHIVCAWVYDFNTVNI